MASWTNNDGLPIYFGPEEGFGARGGEYEDRVAGMLIHDYVLPLTTLTTANSFVTRDLVETNFTLEKVEVYVELGATTGSAAALNVGFWNYTLNSAVAAQGAVAALAVASMATAGTVNTLTVGSTSVGTKVGAIIFPTAVPSNNLIGIIASTSVGTFTAGIVRVRLWMRRSLALGTNANLID